MAVTMVRDYSGRGEVSSRRLQVNDSSPEMRLGVRLSAPDFSDLAKDFAKDVNDLQFQAGHAIDMLATGQAADVHQVMVAVEEAGIARDMMLEIRNRVRRISRTHTHAGISSCGDGLNEFTDTGFGDNRTIAGVVDGSTAGAEVWSRWWWDCWYRPARFYVFHHVGWRRSVGRSHSIFQLGI